jgi:hypothetical protein
MFRFVRSRCSDPNGDDHAWIALKPVPQSRDERHIGGGHWVIAQPLLPHPGEMSATAITVKTSPLRFMKATPIPPRPNEAGSFLVANAPSENRNRLRRNFS